MIEPIVRDLKFGLRTLRKNPGFAAAAILTLALGIGANSAIFSIIESVLLKPLPYAQPGQLVEIFNKYPPQFPKVGLSPGDYADWKRQATSYSEMGGYIEISFGENLTGDGGEPQHVEIGYMVSDLLPMLGIRPVAGRGFQPAEDQRGAGAVVILGHEIWTGRFGADPNVIGRQISLDNDRYTIVGVLPANVPFARGYDLWLSYGQYFDDLTEHVHHGVAAIARLKPGSTIQQAQAELDGLNHQELIAYPDSHRNWGAGVAPLEDAPAAKLRTTLMMLFAAVGLVLLIACANTVNLLLARNSVREREIALRTALGASRGQLARQLLTESVLLAFLGGALGLALAGIALKAVSEFAPANLAIVRQAHLDLRVVEFTLGICFLAGLICGVMPAMDALRRALSDVLKQGSKGSSGGRARLHNALVIAEVAMTLVPLVGAGLLLKSFRNLLEESPGFRADHVLTMEVPHAEPSFAEIQKLSQEEQNKLNVKDVLEFEGIAQKISALPGVKAAGGVSLLPLSPGGIKSASRFVIEGQAFTKGMALPVAQMRTISLGYLGAMGVPLMHGRAFTQDDWNQPRVLINRRMEQRYFAGGTAVGKRINLCSLDPKPCWFEIEGVVGDVHQFGLEAEQTPDVYFSGGWTQEIVIRTNANPASVAASARDVIHAADAMLPVGRVMTFETVLSDSVAPRRFSAVLTGVFAGLALLLASVGIFGVMSYTVSRRTREIGIRMALGSEPGSVRGIVLSHTLKLTVAGVVLGAIGALALTRFLQTLLFGVKTYDAVTFFSVAALLAAVGAAAAYLPARRASCVDPMIALRDE
ncbi:MAG TPA: ABC transporter permease [Candidatus Acidoferrales bacterium]|nr:ABC transporter permease [Candidatus Acidoferrales bacterium]